MQKRVRSKHTAKGSPTGNPRPPEEVGEGLEAQRCLPPPEKIFGGVPLMGSPGCLLGAPELVAAGRGLFCHMEIPGAGEFSFKDN